MEDELDRTLREIESQGQIQRQREKTLKISWILLGVGAVFTAACAVLLMLLLPKLGADPKERAAWGMAVGGLGIGLVAGVVATLFFASRVWRLLLGVSPKKKVAED